MWLFHNLLNLCGVKRMSLYDEFIKEYDDGSLQFNDINYRKGATITASLGLSNGYREVDGNLEWGYVRIHSGVDRAKLNDLGGPTDIVISPFNFNRSKFIDYNGVVYGSLTSLFNDKYGFEFRIAHMELDKILILDDLKQEKPIYRDVKIGTAGDYGLSAGEHTHTEVKSINEKSEVLEQILTKKFGDDVNKQYSEQEVLAYYRTTEKFSGTSNSEILKDWQELKSNRGCLFINKYLYRYIDYDNSQKTRYSTEHLWNGL